MRRTTCLAFAAIALFAYLAGYWSHPMTTAIADSGETPLITVQAVRGDTGLTVYYPSLKKFFVYQSPFVGLPSWNCAYSIQLSTPGGPIEREPCPATGQVF
jgi:hypothetical protein